MTLSKIKRQLTKEQSGKFLREINMTVSELLTKLERSETFKYDRYCNRLVFKLGGTEKIFALHLFFEYPFITESLTRELFN